MRLRCSILLLWGLLCISFAAFSADDYILGAGDQIEIRVYGHPDLTTKSTLGSDGFITFQFVGELPAQGLTVNQLSNRIQSGLADGYIVNPLVSINIVKYRNFYIQGEVERPGGYAFEPGINISKAIALAGGLTDRGSKNKIDLISQKAPDKKTESVALDTAVNAGDIIVVGQRFF
ncbi:polysaccharide biosynthesis/export family protein [Alteromonas sp. a30]|uniref:polysaccharide biosynthesis/export family protein n=1 Tax=Alteromonas sp. a30 TaxID=2730917 RepID=UPI002281225A|nr:polysaccharide biosynthesis/export family protein [Alteromonas sp. a30]MCY7296106.1 polysaccharide export protein [Alteromonas sp. a30]